MKAKQKLQKEVRIFFLILEFDTWQYFIKVVSTEVKYLNGTVAKTNQYASTEHARDVTPVMGDMPTAMPGKQIGLVIARGFFQLRHLSNACKI